MKFAAMFLWLIVPISIWGAVTLWGTPHLVVTYQFLDNGDRYNPLANRRYTRCTYWGWYGAITVPARKEQCPWVRFFKMETR